MPSTPVRTILSICSILLSIIALSTGGCATSPETGKPSAKPELALVLLSSENIFAANFSVETFGPWMKQASSICEQQLAKEPNPPHLLVQITLRKDASPIYELSGQPRLSDAFIISLQNALSTLPQIHPPYCNVSLRFQSIDSSTTDPIKESEHFIPSLELPGDKDLDQFASASIAEEYTQLRHWSAESALPMLSAEAAGVDPKFAGVISMGKLVQRTNLSAPIDVEALTFKNPDYWRGVMEMAPGNDLVAAMPVLMFAANGEMDKAQQMLQFVLPFADHKVLAGNLLEEFSIRFRLLEDKIQKEIERGIALHQARKFDEAIAVYQNLLAGYPCSAWARYELFYSTLNKGGPKAVVGEGMARWDAAAPEIYQKNPLYDVQFYGARGKTMGALLDRVSLRAIIEKSRQDWGEYYGRTAELAVRLECYGYAAHVYWLAMSSSSLKLKELGLPEKKEPTVLTMDDVICRYLYCLEKLGCPHLKENFKDDYSARFRQLDEQLEKHRTQ